MPKALPCSTKDRITPDPMHLACFKKANSVALRHNSRPHYTASNEPRRNLHHLLIQDLDVRIVNAATGELLRELTIDPERDYQPRKSKDPNPH